MAVSSVEARLAEVRKQERSHMNWLMVNAGTVALGGLEAATNLNGSRMVGLAVTVIGFAGGAKGIAEVYSASQTAAVLEGVVAQQAINEPAQEAPQV